MRTNHRRCVLALAVAAPIGLSGSTDGSGNGGQVGMRGGRQGGVR